MKTAAVVDAYSTGAALAEAFRGAGYECVHIQSSAEILSFDETSFLRDDFVQNLVGEDVGSTARSLRDLGVEFVVPGCESGVMLADRLAEELNLKRNDFAQTRVRRNKFLMSQRLREAGLAHARSFLVHTEAELLAASRSLGGFPQVVKPVDSAGSDGVHFCQSHDDLREAFHLEIGKINEMGQRNECLLLMEFLSGQQYKVQSVSCSGLHESYEVWRDDRVMVAGAGVINAKEVLVPADSSECRAVVDYVREVLTAFGVCFGVSFSEVMVTNEGVVLIESAARIMGTQDLEVISDVSGFHSARLCVASYLGTRALDLELAKSVVDREHLCVAGLLNEHSGRLTSMMWWRALRDRPTFRGMLRAPVLDDELVPTMSFSTNFGLVYLAHKDPELVEADYEWIRSREKRPGGFFELEAEC